MLLADTNKGQPSFDSQGKDFDILTAGRHMITMGEHARRAAADIHRLPTLRPAFPQ